MSVIVTNSVEYKIVNMFANCDAIYQIKTLVFLRLSTFYEQQLNNNYCLQTKKKTILSRIKLKDL